MKQIIIVYTFSPFPCGDAVANRILAYALSMQDVGYKVIVLTNTPSRECDYHSEKSIYSYMNIEYRSYYVNGLNKIMRVIHRNNIIRIVNDLLLSTEKKNICLFYTTYRNFGFFLHAVLKYKKIPVVVDVTEWHSSSQFKYGMINPKYFFHSLKNRFLVPRAKNIICITRYLENFYKARGCNTLYLPPQIVIKDYVAHSLPNIPPVKLFYAGNMQKKDYIWLALEGLILLSDEEKNKVQCVLAGCSEDSFRSLIPNGDYYIKSLQHSLKIIDKISKDAVQKNLSESHFLILMRPQSRYSSAGFPSKVPEALAAGVPVITNRTSDLEHFIFDMENGIIVNEFTAEAFATAVRKAITIDNEKFKYMSKIAYNSAKKYFNYEAYNETIRIYLSDITR